MTHAPHLRPEIDAVLRVRDLVVDFPMKRGQRVHAVSGVSFDVARGETLGIVGESGCGKSTTGRAIMQMPRPTSGSVEFDVEMTCGNERERNSGGSTRVQMIFQDPISSLNPRRRVRDSVLDPLDIWQRGTDEERSGWVDAILEEVGIDPARAHDSRPHQFSGGQCQRIAIARALVLDPTLIICDEPVSALDVSVQAQVLNLLEDLKAAHGLTMIFIAHDLAVVKLCPIVWPSCTSDDCARLPIPTGCTPDPRTPTHVCCSTRFPCLIPPLAAQPPASVASRPHR